MRKKRDETLRAEAVAGANGAEDGVDVDAGIIVVDDSPPEQTINTSEILRTGDDLGGDTASGARPGKVFILDIGPIFKLLGVKPKDRPGHNLNRFCDNLLARSVARLGTYEAQGADCFLFRLNMNDDRALRAAIAGKIKLSQNRTDADRAGVIAALNASVAAADQELAAAMQSAMP
jgi:hypothetical protein